MSEFKGLIAAGGWCAPSAQMYDLLGYETDGVKHVREPDELPPLHQWREHEEWVVYPTTDYYDKEDLWFSEESALARYRERIAFETDTEGIWVEHRIVRSRNIIAGHGTHVPDPNNKGGFPEVSVERGGITYEGES